MYNPFTSRPRRTNPRVLLGMEPVDIPDFLKRGPARKEFDWNKDDYDWPAGSDQTPPQAPPDEPGPFNLDGTPVSEIHKMTISGNLETLRQQESDLVELIATRTAELADVRKTIAAYDAANAIITAPQPVPDF